MRGLRERMDNAIPRGAAAGLVATVAMTPVQLVGMRLIPRSLRDRWMPHHVFRGISRKLGVARHLDDKQEDALTVLAHFGYGALFGVLYALWRRRNGASLLSGVTFGLTLWAVSYGGYLPLSGLTPPAERHDAFSMTRLAVAHAVYGAALGLLGPRRRGGAAQPV